MLFQRAGRAGKLDIRHTLADSSDCDAQMLQTQFWDTNPATGPQDHWTIHGLW